MAGECIHLFVYGTLLSRDSGVTGRSQRARLAREARLVGAGTVAGQLYDLGRYPGLVLANMDGARVIGEVLELSSPPHTLTWLDVYEGIVPGDHPHNEYERLAVDVLMADGTTIEAWTYVYRLAPRARNLIASGSWLDR